MANYNLNEIKNALAGRWADVLSIDSAFLTGRHGPCPKCGGNDRFRCYDDFDQTGGVVCSHCFPPGPRSGDGIETYRWWHNLGDSNEAKSQAIEACAKAAGIQPTKPASSKSAPANQTSQPSQPRTKDLPAVDRFKWLPWNESLASIFCVRKTGIVPTSLVDCEARLGTHYGTTCICLPIRNDQKTIGYTAAAATGGMITIQYGDKEEKTKWKNVLEKGQKGIIGTLNLWSDLGSVSRVFKVEGPSDLLAIVPFLQPGEGAFCNPAGAGENPMKFDWLESWLADKSVVVIHDRDKAGQDGALGDEAKRRLGWATWAAQFAESVHNLELPFPLVDSHGQDLRDWVNGGGTREGLDQLIDAAKRIEWQEPLILEDGSDPHYLARCNLEQYKEKHGRRLVYWKSEWFSWKAGRYVRIEESEFRSKINAAIRREFEKQWRAEFAEYCEFKESDKYDPDKDKGPPKIKKVTPQLVTAVISATASMVQLPGSITMPCWLPDRSSRHYISMANGILDMDQVFAGKDVDEFLIPHSSNWFSELKLDYQFDFESQCPTWMQYLNYCMEGDQERIAILQEWAGYLLCPTNWLQKFLVLEGEGGNGKTVYLAAMRAMIGAENTSSVALEKFAGRFDLTETLGKAANIVGDAGEMDSVCEGTLKQFTGGDRMTFDRKNKSPLQAIPSAKLMMSWNTRPRFKDRSKGLWRRMLIIPFQREVAKEDRITGLDSDKFWTEKSGELPAILRWAIEGYDRLMTQGKFTESQVVNDAAIDYRMETNPALDFLINHVEEDASGTIKCQWLYSLYDYWCKQTNHRPLAQNQFGKEVRRAFPKAVRARSREHTSRAYEYQGISFSVDRVLEKFVYDIDL